MSFFKVSKESKDIEEKGASNYINKSGLYDVTILAPIVDVNEFGAPTVNFYIDYNGQKQTIYGQLRLQNNDGSEAFSAKVFNKLCVIADIDVVEDPIEAVLPIGKDGADKDVAVLEQFADLEVKMWVQMEYGAYNGNITEKKVIKGFYRADGASVEEIVNETEVGVSLEKSTKYFDNVKYKDGVTSEQVEEWIKAERPKGTAGSSTTTTAKPSFGKKKFGAK